MPILKTANKFLNALSRYYLPEALLFLISAGLYLYNSFKYSMPTGYAGLYTLMTDLLIGNGFKIPQMVPYYGPGGFPYVYPPAGFYLAAIIEKLFDLSYLNYLRFVPPILTLLFLGLDYILIRRITSSRIKALFGVAFTVSAGAVYEYHVQAAGMVRALALVFATVALIFCWEALFIRHSSRSSYLLALLAGVALGLTVLSHLSYALFAILGILVFVLFAKKLPWLDRVKYSAIIFGSGFLVSSVWWATILIRYGLSMLISPAQSHGNFGALKAIITAGVRMPVVFLQRLLGVPNDWIPVILAGLIISGFLYIILKRKWLFTVWFLAVFLLVGEAKRFLVIIGCIVAAELIGSVFEFVYQQDLNEKHVNLPVYLFAGLILLTFCLFGGYRIVRSDSPTLTPALVEMSTFVQKNTPVGSSYLLLDSNYDMDEWIPYFTQRAPTIGSWGAEWIGKSDKMAYMRADLDICLTSQSYACVQAFTSQNDVHISSMISTVGKSVLNDQIMSDTAWQVGFKNDQFIVFVPNQ